MVLFIPFPPGYPGGACTGSYVGVEGQAAGTLVADGQVLNGATKTLDVPDPFYVVFFSGDTDKDCKYTLTIT